MADGLLTSGLNWIDQQKQALKARFGLLADNPEEFARQLAAEQCQRAGVGLIGEPKTAEEMASGAWINTPYGQQAMEAGSGFAGTTIGKNAIAAAKETLNKPRMGVWQGEKPLDMWKAEQQARIEENIRQSNKQKFLEQSAVKQRMYHGTDQEITQFNPKYIGKNDFGWYGPGHYLTADPGTASAYADYAKVKVTGKLQSEPSEGANVLPVYAQLKNPYYWPENRPVAKNAEESSAIGKELRDKGYDGIIVSNKYQSPEYANFHEVIVFDPKRIKSAIGNIGTYDITNPNILAAGVPLGLLAGTNVEMPKKQEKKSMTPKR